MNRSLAFSHRLWSFLLCAALAAAFSTTARAAADHYWQDVRATVSLHDLATDGRVYVGGGGLEGNGLWISSDLKTWTRANLPATVGNSISSVAYENGTFIAVSNTIITSSDGISWTVADVPVTLDHQYSAVTYGNGVYVVVGSNVDSAEPVVLTSADGNVWTRQKAGVPAPADTYITFNGVAWNGTRFVAVGTFIRDGTASTIDVIITSTDARNWSQMSLPGDGKYGLTWSSYNDGLAYGNGTFVAGGGGGVYTSADGLTWAAHTMLDDFWATAIEFAHGIFIAPALTYGPLGGHQQTGYLFSTDGVSWTFGSVDPNEGRLKSASVVYNDGKYVIAGEAGVWSSSDLTNWAKQFSGPQSNKMGCLGHGKGSYVLLGSDSDEVLVSSNGRDWPDELTPIATRIGYTHSSYHQGCIAYGPGGYVSNNYRSIDGIDWQAAAVPPDDDIWLVAHNSSKYLAVARNFSNSPGDLDILVSNDGMAWSQISDDLPYFPFPSALQVINDSFFLIGQNGKPGWNIFSSSDGATWTDVTPPVPDSGFPRIGYGNDLLIAMWTDDDLHVKIARSSDDGAKWEVEKEAFPGGLSFVPASISYGGGIYVAVGYEPKSEVGAYLVSTDGERWTFAIDNRVGPFNTLLWDGSKFVATGSFDVLNLTGGIPAILLNVHGGAAESVEPGQTFAITVTVSNDGSVRADDVVLNDILPTSATYTGVTSSQGQCTKSGGTLSCALGTIGIGAEATVTLNFTAGAAEGDVTNRSSVGAYQPMRDDADLESSTTVTVRKPPSDDKGGSEGGGGGGALGALGVASLLSLAMRRRTAAVEGAK